MRSFQKPARRGLILALPLSLSLLAACGGGDDVAGATDGAGPAAATLAAAVPADASQEALPEAVEARAAQDVATDTAAPEPAAPSLTPPQPEVVAKAYSLQSPISTTYASAITIGEALAKVNAARAVGRLCGTTWYPAAPPLAWNEALARAATGHSLDMATKNYFSHTSLDGRSFIDRIEAQGYADWRAAAENISAGSSTMDATLASWLQSSGHCRNIMNARYKDYGVSVAYKSGSRYGMYWTQNFGVRF